MQCKFQFALESQIPHLQCYRYPPLIARFNDTASFGGNTNAETVGYMSDDSNRASSSSSSDETDETEPHDTNAPALSDSSSLDSGYGIHT